MHFVLIRGLARNHLHWALLPQEIESRFKKLQSEGLIAQGEKLTLHYLDLPGTGEKFQETSPWSLHRIAENLLSDPLWQKHQKVDHIIALSLGAMTVLAGLNDFENRSAKITLINTSDRRLSTISERFQLKLIPTLLKEIILFRPRVIESIILRLTVNHFALNTKRGAEYLQKNLDIFKKYPFTRGLFMKQILAGTRFSSPPKSSLTRPNSMQFLASKQDRLVNSQCSQRLALDYDCSIHMHPTAGHDLSIDDPEWTAQRILDFTLMGSK